MQCTLLGGEGTGHGRPTPGVTSRLRQDTLYPINFLQSPRALLPCPGGSGWLLTEARPGHLFISPFCAHLMPWLVATRDGPGHPISPLTSCPAAQLGEAGAAHGGGVEGGAPHLTQLQVLGPGILHVVRCENLLRLRGGWRLAWGSRADSREEQQTRPHKATLG